jgi:hypothetical protein
MTAEPNRRDFPDEIEYCRAMQRWARDEVPVENNQRLICITDWFNEELLRGVE